VVIFPCVRNRQCLAVDTGTLGHGEEPLSWDEARQAPGRRGRLRAGHGRGDQLTNRE
jgi:hypothetical protein